ncbi:FecR family protein [Lutibacter sp.]|uniref:FecR family protein n=1 Tax=Lutibacter sp. TaxID=1925666 RepID=UPI00356A967E
MPVFNKIIALSKHLAASLLQDKETTDLHNSELFSVQDKQYILDNLTNDTLIKERLNLAKQIDKQADWNKIKSKINVPVRKLYWKYTAAAILVVALASTYFLRDTAFNNQIENTTPIIVNNKIEKGTDKATLTLEDGSIVILEKGSAYQAKNANSNGEQIIYDDLSNDVTEELAYNYLTIPRGGQFQLTLSDGTKVWLNSESQLKYPVSFVNGESRHVELVYGEAYFEVSPSTEHNGATFKVFNKAQEIEVLGTKFNIKAYKDEANIYTTLVEGKVVISSAVTKQLLAPNQQSNLNITTNKMSINNIDIKGEIAWVNGKLILQGKTLKEIMTVLSRWYDMDVIFANKALEEVRFVGILRKNQDIVDILNIIKNFNVIKDYEIHDKQVILK